MAITTTRSSRPTLPSRHWGARATPPAALIFQQQQQRRQQQQQQEKSRYDPLWRASRTQASSPLPRHFGLELDRNDPLVPFGAACRGSAPTLERRSTRSVLLAMSTVGEGVGKDNEDIWRDSALRYAGYANEVGESFRNIAPRFVVPSYAVSIAYVCGDTIDKAYKDYSKGKGMVAVGKMGFDVLLWQSLASVAVPGLTINLVVKAMGAAMTNDQAKRLLSKSARKWTPTAVGLGIIPLIITPIDHAVTIGMDETVRKWLA